MNTLDAEIEAKRQEIRDLQQQKDKDEFKVIDSVLEEWHQKLTLCPYNKNKRFQLFIRGCPRNNQQYLGMKSVQFCRYDETNWTIRHYLLNSPVDAQPKQFSADTISALLPANHPESTNYMCKFSVVFDIVDAELVEKSKQALAIVKTIEQRLYRIKDVLSITTVHSQHRISKEW